jgi:type I restriction enzyme S subunit
LADGPFGSNLKTQHYVDEGPRVIRLQNIGEGFFRDERAHIAQEHYERLLKHAVRPRDVVVASLGEETPRACLVPQWLGAGVVKADCVRVRPLDGVDSAYLMWMLNSPPVRQQAAKSIKGIGRPRLGLGGIRRLRMPVPPLAEQLRIVAAIEEHLSRLEGAASALSTATARLDLLRRSAGLSWFPDEWQTKPLAALVNPGRPIRYGILMPKEDVPNGVSYVRVRDYPAETVLVNELKRTSPEIAMKYRRSSLEPGDVLVSIRGTFGRVAVVPPDLDGANITQDTARIALIPDVDRDYVVAYLRSEPAQRFFRQVARGVAVRGVNLGDLRKLPVPLPPRDEQRRIAAEAGRLSTLINALATDLKEAQRRCFVLRRAILERAFRGELVPQDPKDEPASALLERIAAERAAAPKATRKRKEPTRA